MAIIAVTVVAVTLAVGSVGERRLERDAEALRALIGYACEQAELRGRQIGISLNREGYRFSRSDHDEWLLENDGELRPRKWSVTGATMLLSRDGARVEVVSEFPRKPQLVCFSSGELTAFRLELGLPDSSAHYRLDGRSDGDVAASVVDTRVR